MLDINMHYFTKKKNAYDLAWKQIDQAYTESKKKIFSIANTHVQ